MAEHKHPPQLRAAIKARRKKKMSAHDNVIARRATRKT